jgi:hypothetical protein
MIRRSIRISLLAAVFIWGCGSDDEADATRDPGPPDGSEEAAQPCTRAAACVGCVSCTALCECAGGSPSECADECDGDVGGEPPPPPPEVVKSGDRSTVTLITQEFEVPPGGETFRCQNFANPFGEDVAIVESRSSMASGSHHMFVFQTAGLRAGGLETCGGLEFSANIHSSQRSEESYVYPPGIGRMLFANEGLRVQAHYLNTTSETITAYVAVTLEAVAPAAVETLAAQVFINTLSINVPPQSQGAATKSCGVPQDIQLLTASSHMHRFGTHFEARTSDGQLVYETNEWAEPDPWHFDPPLPVPGGASIDIRCEYDNTTDTTLSFGESADTNEMCILSGLYYPAPQGAGIICLF